MEHGDQSAKWGKLGTINHGMASIGLCFVAQPISELWIVSSS
jgi:translation initiation factor 6 (eIF-6)